MDVRHTSVLGRLDPLVLLALEGVGVILKVINNIAKTHAGSLVLIGKLKTYSATICTAMNLSG